MRKDGERRLRGLRRGMKALFPIWAAISVAAGAQSLPPPGGGEGGGDPPITAFISPPAEQWAVTPGGVDARTGQYAYSQTDLSIGEAAGTGGISLIRGPMSGAPGHINPFGNFSHNWDIMLTEKRVDIEKGNYEHGSGQDYRLQVAYGGRSETFESPSYSSGFTYVSRNNLVRLTYPAGGNRASAGIVYTFQAGDGSLYTFRPMGSGDCSSVIRCAYVSQIVRPDGTVFAFEYDNPSETMNGTRLRSVTSTRGYALLFEYGGTLPYTPSAACVINLAQVSKPSNNMCPAGAMRSSYTYTGFGVGTQIASATDASGATWSFSYWAGTGNARYMGFVRPGETTPWLVNGYHASVNQDGGAIYIIDNQAFATGEAYYYQYDSPPNAELPSSIIAGGSYTDALGRVTILQYAFPRRPRSLNPPGGATHPGHENFGDAFIQLTPGPVRIVDPLGRTTVADYCDPYLMAALPPTDIFDRCVVTRLQSYTDPEGIRTELELSSNGLPTRVRRIPQPGSGLATIEMHATYACASPLTCLKPASLTDARGAVTNFTYSPVHGGVLTETLPAPGAGAPRPQTRYEYVQRYAWVRNSAGAYVQAAQPIWLLSATSLCRTSAATGNPSAPCATAGDEVRTTFDYGPNGGPNNLLLRGQVVTATDGGVTTSLRTCYGYDQSGRRISETEPEANLGSCA